jgi:AmmeMemoRadiSam system protein B
MRSINEIRPSPIAGHWYSANPNVLREEIQSYLNKVNLPSINGEVKGLIAPHAGYRYSGQTAAYSFKAVLGESYDLVVLLSPFHQYHPATLLCSAHDYYQTPLGKIKVNQDITNALISSVVTMHGIDSVKIANDEEHSLEIELPFLQCVLDGDFDLLPIMVRSVEPNLAQLIANSLFEVIKGKKVLIVSSTDLSHFYPKTLAEKFDQEMLTQIETFSVQNVYQAELKGEGFACGLGAVMVGMACSFLLGADKVKILHHSTSGDVTGDHSSVVGYGSAVFLSSHL